VGVQAPPELVAEPLDGYEGIAKADSEYPVNLLTFVQQKTA